MGALAAVYTYSAYAVSPLALPLVVRTGRSLRSPDSPGLGTRAGDGSPTAGAALGALRRWRALARGDDLHPGRPGLARPGHPERRRDREALPSARRADRGALLVCLLGLLVAQDTAVVIRVFLFWLAFYLHLPPGSSRSPRTRCGVRWSLPSRGRGILGAIRAVDYSPGRVRSSTTRGLGLQRANARHVHRRQTHFASMLLLDFFPAWLC